MPVVILVILLSLSYILGKNEIWWGVVFIFALILGMLYIGTTMVTLRGWPFERLALKVWSNMDLWGNYLSRGTLLGYSGLARIPRICVVHYGCKTGHRRVTPVMPYFLRDRENLAITGMVIAGTNMGDEKPPAWVANLRKMELDNKHGYYNLEQTIIEYKAKEILEEHPDRQELLKQMREFYPALDDYAETANREIALFELKTMSEHSWWTGLAKKFRPHKKAKTKPAPQASGSLEKIHS